MIWYDKIWYNMIWYDMTWYDMTRHNMIRYVLLGDVSRVWWADRKRIKKWQIIKKKNFWTFASMTIVLWRKIVSYFAISSAFIVFFSEFSRLSLTDLYFILSRSNFTFFSSFAWLLWEFWALEKKW